MIADMWLPLLTWGRYCKFLMDDGFDLKNKIAIGYQLDQKLDLSKSVESWVQFIAQLDLHSLLVNA